MHVFFHRVIFFHSSLLLQILFNFLFFTTWYIFKNFYAVIISLGFIFFISKAENCVLALTWCKIIFYLFFGVNYLNRVSPSLIFLRWNKRIKINRRVSRFLKSLIATNFCHKLVHLKCIFIGICRISHLGFMLSLFCNCRKLIRILISSRRFLYIYEILKTF